MPENKNFFSSLLQVRQSNRDLIDFLKEFGFTPGSIIDVGVAMGTPEIYSLDDRALLILIEPINEFQPYIDGIKANREALVYSGAAAAHDGEIELWVTPDMTTSSLLKPLNATQDVVKRKVPCWSLDTLARKDHWPKPYLLKIDVQGAELDVLNGAHKLLEDTEIILLEVSLFSFTPGLPDFYQVIHYMKKKGFVVYDLFNGHNRPLDNARGQVDVAFVKEEGLFRENTIWGTAEQCHEFLTCKFSMECYQKLNPSFPPTRKSHPGGDKI